MEILRKYIQALQDNWGQFALGFLVLIIFGLIARMIRAIISKKLKNKTKNPLLTDFLGKLGALIVNILSIGLFLEIVGLGNIASHLLAGAGIATFVIGFAFKDIGENFLSGIILAFKSPFGVNDMVQTEDVVGFVAAFDIRETHLKTLDGRDVFVPNAQILKNPLINYTLDGYLRYEFVVGLDYDADIDSAIAIVKSAMDEIDEVLKTKKTVVVVDELMASTINLKIYYWIDTFSSKSKSYHLQIRSNVIIKVVESLLKAGYYLPADIVEIKNYNKSQFKVN